MSTGCCVVSGCNEMFTNQTDHLLNTHCIIVQGILHCPFPDCHVTCYNSDVMTYHLCSCHTHDKPYHCFVECQCSFSLEANVKTHQRVRHNIQEMKIIPGCCTSVQQYNDE